MRVFRHYDEMSEECRGAVVALGNFDGVHRGHQIVLRHAIEYAAKNNLPSGVLTFEPHPRAYFSPDRPPFRLTPFRTKMRLFQAMGLDFSCCLAFDKMMAERSADAFIGEILIEGLKIARIVVGEDFCFGRGRMGNISSLIDAGKRLGFGVEAISSLKGEDGLIYSSTAIREKLLAGEIDGVVDLLGRPWEIAGRVEHGDRRGRELGFPTANIALHEYLHPKPGVYAIRVMVEESGEEWHEGVANIGRRPTIGELETLLEVHLFDFSQDLYAKHLRVALLGFIRPERKFDSLQALSAQIAEDCGKARVMTRAYSGPMPDLPDLHPAFGASSPSPPTRR